MFKKSFILAVIFMAAVIAKTQAETFRGRVVKVYDGDSIAIVLLDTLEEHEIRLQAVDAPENGQPCWRDAQLFLAELLHGQIVRVEVEKRDKYKRLVGRVFINETGLDVEMELIRNGLAWHYAYYNQEPELAKAQEKAQSEKIGIWKESAPVEPYIFRKKKRQAALQNLQPATSQTSDPGRK